MTAEPVRALPFAGRRGRSSGPAPRTALVAIGCGLLAVAVRLLLVRSEGGLAALGNYDDSVYFGSAVALVHGRLPYRDFLFLQPPGITLLLTPFAAAARLVGEHDAWVAARLAFVLLGGVNAALAVAVLRRQGRVAALLAGLWIALSRSVALPDRSTLLEGVGTCGVLLALLLLAGPAAGPRRPLLAGAALGAAVAIKVFFLVPLAVLVLLDRRRPPLLAGAGAALLVLLGPFFAAAPAAMWRQVVLDQLGRPRTGSEVARLRGFLQPPALPGIAGEAALVVLATAAAVVLVVALTRSGARCLALLTIAGGALLLAAPSFYGHYAVLAAAPLGLAVAAVLGPPLDRLRARGARGALAAAAAVLLVAGVLVAGWRGTGITTVQGVRVPAGLGAAIRAVPGCTTTLSPGLLLLTGTDGLQLERGCSAQVDPTGAIYDLGGPAGLPPQRDARWQRAASASLRSGAAVLLRNGPDWFDRDHLRRLRSGEVRFASGRTVLRTIR